MLTMAGDRWRMSAGRLAVLLDGVENRIGKKNTTRILVAAPLVLTVAMIVTSIMFKGHMTDYKGLPIVAVAMYVIVMLAFAVLPIFAETVQVLNIPERVERNYALRLLLSPAIKADRKALWRHRAEINMYLLLYSKDWDNMISRGATLHLRDETRASRLRTQEAAANLAKDLGHDGVDFADHMAGIDNEVYHLEAMAIHGRLADEKAARERFVNSYEDTVAGYDKRIADLERLAAMVKL